MKHEIKGWTIKQENWTKEAEMVQRNLKRMRKRKAIKKLIEIGAILSCGIAMVSDIIDYFYIPSDLKLVTLIGGAIAMVLWIISMALENH